MVIYWTKRAFRLSWSGIVYATGHSFVMLNYSRNGIKIVGVEGSQ